MNKTVLITGASGGIGSACARLFSAAGYNTALHCFHNRAAAESLAKELNAAGGSAACFCADLCSEEQTELLLENAAAALGDIGTLVNNAGVAQQKLFTQTTRADYDFVFGANILGTVNACRAALPAMLRAHEGSIVNVSSMWGVSGASCEALYSASKAAVIGLTKALAKEVGPSGITVNCVAPGVINTKMNSQLSVSELDALAQETPLCRLGEPEEVAQAVLFFASREASFITGQVLSVDGGFVL